MRLNDGPVNPTLPRASKVYKFKAGKQSRVRDRKKTRGGNTGKGEQREGEDAATK